MLKKYLMKTAVLAATIALTPCFAAETKSTEAAQTNDASAQKQMIKSMQAVMNKPIYKNSGWGVMIKDLDSGKILYQQNQNKLFTPASTTKLFTTAATLQALGPDFRYKTPVYRQGNVDADGTLDGNLILVASGDLTMGWRNVNDQIIYTDFDHTEANTFNVTDKFLLRHDPVVGLDNLAKQIAATGIKRVNGDVIIDDRLFEKSYPRNSADMLRTPIIINDNTIDFVVKPGNAVGSQALFSFRPASKYYQLDAQVQTVAKGKGNHFIGNIVEPNRLVIRGQIEIGAPSYLKVYRVNDPASFARSLLIDSLNKVGISVEASALAPNPTDKLPAKATYASLPSVAMLTSPPLTENAKLILKVSHNLGADLLPLQVALKNGKNTFDDGIELEKKYLDKLGVKTSEIVINDGMGAGPNFISPEVVIQLLSGMYKVPYFQSYLNAQPILGIDAAVDASLYEKMTGPAKGHVYAKTGTLIEGDSLNQRAYLFTQGLAGYIKTAKNKTLAFVVYVNNVPLASVNQSMDIAKDVSKLAEIVYEAE